MTFIIPNMSFQRCEQAIVLGRTDTLVAAQKGHDRTLTSRFIDAVAEDCTLPPGTSCSESAQVTDLWASHRQQNCGLARWQHTRTVNKTAVDALEVTDSLLFVENGSAAQRTYGIGDASNGATQAVSLWINPWQVNLQNVHMAGLVAGLMRKQMEASDANLPQLLSAAAQN